MSVSTTIRPLLPTPAGFSHAHRIYVKALFKRACLDAKATHYDSRMQWRRKVYEIRDEFDAAKDLVDPRAIGAWIKNYERDLTDNYHHDPIIYPKMPGGVLYERNTPPPQWTEEEWAAGDAYMLAKKLTPERSRAEFEAEKAYERLIEDYKTRRAVYLDDTAALAHARADWAEDAEASHVGRGGSPTTWVAEAARAGDHFDLRPWKEAVDRIKAFEELEREVHRVTDERTDRIIEEASAH